MKHESDEAHGNAVDQVDRDVESHAETAEPVAEEHTGKSIPHRSIVEHLVRESLSPLENEMTGELHEAGLPHRGGS